MKKLKLIYELAHNNPPSPLRDEAFAHLEECASATGEYSAMVRAALEVGFIEF